MNSGMRGFPGSIGVTVFSLLGSGTTSNRTAVYTAPTSGFYLVTAIGGGSGGDNSSKGGNSGDFVVRQRVYLEGGVAYQVAAGKGGGTGVNGSDTSITGPRGVVFRAAGGDFFTGSSGSDGAPGMTGFNVYPLLKAATGGTFTDAATGYGSGGFRAGSGTAGAIVIEPPSAE